MTLNRQNTGRIRLHVNFSLLLITLTALFTQPITAKAISSPPTLPAFTDFVSQVKNGQRDVLRGVYVANILALPIVQQPTGQTMYVSNNMGEITQFNLATTVGNVGLLAHNNLAGSFFQQLAVGQEVHLIYGDGRIQNFMISQIQRYQALQPENPFSSFRNIDKEETLTSGQMFNRAYLGDQ